MASPLTSRSPLAANCLFVTAVVVVVAINATNAAVVVVVAAAASAFVGFSYNGCTYFDVLAYFFDAFYFIFSYFFQFVLWSL